MSCAVTYNKFLHVCPWKKTAIRSQDVHEGECVAKGKFNIH
jgi:hypothetical protein